MSRRRQNMGDMPFGPGKHLEELGISPTFELDAARRELKESAERLEETIAKRKAIQEQRRKTRQEAARLRGGSVLADHGDDGGDDEDLLVWKWVPVW